MNIEIPKSLAKQYQVLRPLGVGGMGTVHQARDRNTEKIVALKLLNKDLWPETEFLLARKIDHENVCRVFDLSRQIQIGRCIFKPFPYPISTSGFISKPTACGPLPSMNSI